MAQLFPKVASPARASEEMELQGSGHTANRELGRGGWALVSNVLKFKPYLFHCSVVTVSITGLSQAHYQLQSTTTVFPQSSSLGNVYHLPVSVPPTTVCAVRLPFFLSNTGGTVASFQT